MFYEANDSNVCWKIVSSKEKEKQSVCYFDWMDNS